MSGSLIAPSQRERMQAGRNAAFDAFILGAKTLHDCPAQTCIARTATLGGLANLPISGAHDRWKGRDRRPIVAHQNADRSEAKTRDEEVEQHESQGQRKGRRAKLTATACERCRSMKLKCDNGRPCLGCIRKGCAASCVDWDRTRALCRRMDTQSEDQVRWVERPVKWRPSSTVPESSQSFPSPQGQDFEAFIARPPREFLAVVFRKLITKQRISDWTLAFCDEVATSLSDYIKAAALHSEEIRQTFKIRGTLSEQRVDSESRVVGSFPDVAYLKCITGGDACVVNDGYCRLMRTHPEELFGRTRDTDFCHLQTDVDGLCDLLDHVQLITGGGRRETRVVTRYLVMSRSFLKHSTKQQDTAPILVRMTMRLHYASSGAMEYLEKFIRPISVEDYDRALEQTPHLCRPLAAAAGDRRRGAELLASHEEERCQSLSALSMTRSVADKLRALAFFSRQQSASLRVLAPSVDIPTALSPAATPVEADSHSASAQPGTNPPAFPTPKSDIQSQARSMTESAFRPADSGFLLVEGHFTGQPHCAQAGPRFQGASDCSSASDSAREATNLKGGLPVGLELQEHESGGEHWAEANREGDGEGDVGVDQECVEAGEVDAGTLLAEVLNAEEAGLLLLFGAEGDGAGEEDGGGWVVQASVREWDDDAREVGWDSALAFQADEYVMVQR